MASEDSAVENTARWPSCCLRVTYGCTLSEAARKACEARAHCHRATMPTMSASLSAASIEGHVRGNSGRSIPRAVVACRLPRGGGGGGTRRRQVCT